MQKTCSRCSQIFSLENFPKRSLSTDGHNAACRSCVNTDKQTHYWLNESERAVVVARATANKAARFQRDPAYKRAVNLWGSTKKRPTKIPPWVTITDFTPICQKALQKGPGYEIDHVIPIKHPLVCGLHVPSNVRVVLKTTNAKKGNSFVSDWHTI